MNDGSIKNRDQYEATVSLLWGWARMLDQMPLAGALRCAEHADTVGPILHATLWQEKHQALAEDIRLLRAFLSVKAEFAAMKRAHDQ